MGDIALQIERAIGGEIPPGTEVIFETVVNSSGTIGYDSLTGVITLQEEGRYLIQWWIAQQGTASIDGSAFALHSSDGDVIPGNTSSKSGQLVGIAVIDVFSDPIIVTLQNDSSNSVFLSSTVPVKATLTVTSSFSKAYGALSTPLGAVVLSPTPQELFLTIPSPIVQSLDLNETNAITILYTGSYRVDAIVIGTVNEEGIAVSLDLAVNGITDFDRHQSLRCPSGDTVTFMFTTFLTLNAGDVLTLLLSATEEDTLFLFPPFGQRAMLCVQRVS